MRLGLHVLKKTLDQHLRELGEIAERDTTIVFLDTNILAYLYKLHASARKEFFNWTNVLTLIDDRLFIPGWSANEYVSRFKAGDFSEFAPTRPAQVSKSLVNLLDTASLFVDDQSLKKLGYTETRDVFLDGFEKAVSALEKYTRVFNQQFDTWSVHEEITSSLSDRILDSDLAQLCVRAAAQGEHRIAHRLPPGYRDAAKPENRLGDLIIWFELLEHSKNQYAKATEKAEGKSLDVIFLTNDEKSDWVYKPAKRLKDIKGVLKEVTNSEPHIKLPDPVLLSEFHATVGHDRFHITTLQMLVRSLSSIRPKDFENLASAIQIENGDRTEEREENNDQEVAADVSIVESQDEVLAAGAVSDGLPTASSEDSGDRPQSAETDTKGIYPPDAIRDGAYEDDAPGLINEIIRALRSHNWYVQNPTFQKLKEIRKAGFEPGQWFVLGRNIYQAACGNAQKALEFLKNLDIELLRFPVETSNHMLCGMIFEVYFDSEGKLRRRPKATYIDQLLREVAKDLFLPCRSAILHYLSIHGAELPFPPGCVDSLPLEILLDELQTQNESLLTKKLELRSIKFLGSERLIAPPSDGSTIGMLMHMGQSSTSIRRLKAEISDLFAIPKWGIKAVVNQSIEEDQELAIPSGKIFWLR
jgi:hypothetical protein